MEYISSAAEYLRNSGATNDKINDFIDFCGTFKDVGNLPTLGKVITP